MQKKTIGLILALVLFITHSTASLIAPPEIDQNSFRILREVDEIQNFGRVLAEDNAVITPQKRVGLHIYSYLLAGSKTIIPVAVPIVLAALYSCLAFAIYQATRRYTKSSEVSILAALAAGLSSSVLLFYTSRISSMALVLPLWVLTLESFLRLRSVKNRKKTIPKFVVCAIVLSIVHPSVLLLPIVFGVYLGLTSMFRIKIKKIEKEATLFTTAFVVWSQIILYKNAVQMHGIAVIWQNIPPLLEADTFIRLTPIAILQTLGPVLVVGSVIALAYSQWKHQDRFLRLYGSAAGVVLICALGKLLPWTTAMALLAIFLAIIAAKALSQGIDYVKRIRFAWLGSVITTFIAILIITSQLTLAEKKETTNISEDIIQEITQLSEESIIWTHPIDGNEIIYKTKKQIIQTDYFLFDKEADKKYSAYRELIQTKSQIRALELIEETGATHVLVTQNAKKDVGVETIPISEDECFSATTKEGTTFIQVLCRIEKS